MKNEDLCDLIFRKTLLLEGELLNLLTKTPKIAPPPEKKGKRKKKKSKTPQMCLSLSLSVHHQITMKYTTKFL